MRRAPGPASEFDVDVCSCASDGITRLAETETVPFGYVRTEVASLFLMDPRDSERIAFGCSSNCGAMVSSGSERRPLNLRMLMRAYRLAEFHRGMSLDLLLFRSAGEFLMLKFCGLRICRVTMCNFSVGRPNLIVTRRSVIQEFCGKVS